MACCSVPACRPPLASQTHTLDQNEDGVADELMIALEVPLAATESISGIQIAFNMESNFHVCELCMLSSTYTAQPATALTRCLSPPLAACHRALLR